MFILGILGILQVFFIPGIIVLRRINHQLRPVAYTMGVVSASLVFNYCLVFLTTALHIYSQVLLSLVIACEFGLIAWQYRKSLNKSIDHWLGKIRKAGDAALNEWASFFQSGSETSYIYFFIKTIYIILCLILAYISLNWILRLFIWNLGSVFNSYDTIVIWNRWAIDWANNLLPGSTYRYPQLLPTNWSIIYVLMGDTSIQFFAKAIMPLFTFFILLMIVDLGFARKNAGFFIGAAITYLALKKFLGPFVIEGLADLPSAFLAFSAIYFLFLSQVDKQSTENKIGYAILIVLGAAGGAVTKQVGLLFLLLFSIVYFLFFVKPLFRENSKKTNRVILASVLLVLIIVIPWYLYKQVMIWQGLEKSEVQMISTATKHAFNYLSIKDQLLEIIKLFEKYFYLLILLIPLAFFVEPMIRTLILFVVFPLFISWGIFASYDFRNLAIALPIFGISCGISLNYIFNSVFKFLKEFSIGKLKIKYYLIILIVLVTMTGFYFFPYDLLQTRQLEEVMNTFSPSINQKLVTVLEGEQNEFLIMTNYPIDNLPGMAGRKIGVLFNDFDAYQLTLQSANIDTIYLLIPKNSDQKIMDDIDKKLGTGEYTLVFDDESWIHYLFIKDNVSRKEK
jgi:hypothetical protein